MPELRADVLPNDLALTRAPLGWSVLTLLKEFS